MFVQALQQALGCSTDPAQQLQALRSIQQDKQELALAWSKACITAALPEAAAVLHSVLMGSDGPLSTDQLQACFQPIAVTWL